MKVRVRSLALCLGLIVALVGCVADPPATPAPAQVKAGTAAAAAAGRGRLVLATTTSTDDSGLLKYLLPGFEEQFHCRVEVVAVGTGQALKIGQDGDADVLLVHARAQEEQFVANGYGINRLDVMYNDFVIVGPAADPAGVKGLKDAGEALRRVSSSGARFISRGDESGTHAKEKEIWRKAGITPAGGWYISAGQGMGEVLTMASEQGAYTLSDRGTYLAQSRRLRLTILVEGGDELRNPYGVIAVNPARHPNVNAELAARFQEWLTSLPVQAKIAEFGRAEYGQPLFFPDSVAWRQAHGG